MGRPFRNPERLVELAERWPNRPGPRPISTLNYRDWAEQSTVFEQMTAVFGASSAFAPAETPAELRAVVTDFEREFLQRGVETLRAAYRLI